MGQLRWTKIPPVIGATGAVQVNIVEIGMYLNFIKSYQAQRFEAGATPAMLDADAYPITNLGGADNTVRIWGSMLFPSGYAPNGEVWVLKMTGTRHLKFSIGANITNVNDPGGTWVHFGSEIFTFNGTSRVEFEFLNYNQSEASFGWIGNFPHATGTGELILVRKRYEALYDAGEFFNPEFLALMADLNPRTVRTMGFNMSSGQGTNQVQWSHRTKPTGVSYYNETYPPEVWATVSSSDGVAYTFPNLAISNTSAYVDGEIVQCMCPIANTSTAPTLKRGTLAAKPVVNMFGDAVAVGALTASIPTTMIYDQILDKWLYFGPSNGGNTSGGGLTGNAPIEAMVQLANRVGTQGANLWITMPYLWTLPSVTACADLVARTLNPDLKCYFECGNEVWNTFGFFCSSLESKRGVVRGIADPTQAVHGMYGYHLAKVMPVVTSAWLATGRSQATLRRVAAYMAVADNLTAFPYRFDCLDMNATRSPDGIDHTLVGNRARDFCDVVSCAPYFSGSYFTNGPQSYTPAMAATLQTAINNYNAGGASREAALLWLDNDIRHGAGPNAGLTLDAYKAANGVYDKYNQLAIAWAADSGRVTAPTFEAYEGALECMPPVTYWDNATGTNLRLTGTVTFNTSSGPGAQAVNWVGHTLHDGDRVSFDTTGTQPPEVRAGHLVDFFVMNSTTNKFDICANYFKRVPITPSSTGTGTTTAWAISGLDNLRHDYRMDPRYGQPLAFDYLTQFRSYSRAIGPCWFLITEGSAYALMQGDLFSTKFTLYDGVKAFH